MKDRESITIEPEVNEQIKAQATEESRSFSNMIEWMAKKYLESLKDAHTKSNNNNCKSCNKELVHGSYPNRFCLNDNCNEYLKPIK
jgi:predicted CopG family antitoxin